jgi:hypothetical protein
VGKEIAAVEADWRRNVRRPMGREGFQEVLVESVFIVLSLRLK